MKKYFVIILITPFTITSCVPKRKLHSEQRRGQNLQNDSTSTPNKLDECNTQVATLQKEKSSLQGDLESLSSTSKNTIASSQMTIAEQAKRLKDLQNLIQSQKDILNRLMKTVADALVNFKPDELSV